jgi:hypothetical protein
VRQCVSPSGILFSQQDLHLGLGSCQCGMRNADPE